MKPSDALSLHRNEIREIVTRHHAANARVFGSVVTGMDDEASDLDLLVDPTHETTLFDIGAMRSELSSLLGVEVEVLTPKALPSQFRDSVLAIAEPI
jgi:predicted nucleotidyltransferase